MVKSFSAQVDDWTKRSQKRMERVAKTATLAVIEDAQTPVAKGGRMRVDTGFLRASGRVSLDGMPSGPSRNTGEIVTQSDSDPNTVLTIGRAQLGDTIWFGWTANYARFREYNDAFLGIAVQKWQQFVDDAIRKVKAAER